MSYDGIKTNIATRLGTLGYKESKQAFDFEHASVNEYGNTFILNPVSGSLDEGEGGTQNINSQFGDVQLWQIDLTKTR